MNKSLFLSTIAAVVLIPCHFATAAIAVMYHDFGATTGDESTGFITTHQSGPDDESRNTPDLTAKALIDYATGSATGVMFSIDRANGMDSRTPDFTRPPDPGTPADPLFNVPGLNLDNGVFYVGNDAANVLNHPNMTITLTGLNPALIYDLALYGDRNVGADGVERFTLGGADAAINSSSTGIVSTFITDMETRPNAEAGHIVRWTGINPGTDGTITVFVDPTVTSGSNLAYLSAMRLEAVPEPSVVLLLGLSALGLMFHRRRR